MVRKVLKKDWASYADGDFALVNNPWNSGRLKNGPDYTQSVTFYTDDINRDVLFKWDWPSTGRVVAYPEIIAGYKPWGKDGSDSLVTRLDRLSQLDVTIDYDISGNKQKFNVAFDLWLSDKPLAGPGHITTELMIWTHDGNFRPAGEKIGFYRDGDFRAQIWVADNFGDSSGGSSATWRYIAIRSKDEIRSDTIDIAAIIEHLVDRGLIDETDYLNGYEFGAEVTGGRGKLKLNEISHQFDTFDESRQTQENSSAQADEMPLL
ncbi:GH12 family glycosyl hydrolase domain-containing protein [Rhizobium sp.]